jgi:hypothetical protein
MLHFVVKLLLEHERIAYGYDNPVTRRTDHMITRIEAALRDQNKYHDAKESRSLDDLRKMWHDSRSSPKDWRLDNINKARWWAGIDLDQGAREHDWHYDAVENLAEHVRFLDDIQDSFDLDFFLCGPYADILSWLEIEEYTSIWGSPGEYKLRVMR